MRGDFYCCDLTDADAVTCYLMIKPMPMVASLFDTQVKSGTPVVALTFWVRDRKPAAKRGGSGLRGRRTVLLEISKCGPLTNNIEHRCRGA